MRRLPVLLVSALALLAPPLGAADRITGQGFATRSEVIAPHAMAATSQPLATQIALDVMKNGGSAVDAAIAANAALGLMEPTGNGVGGDLFAIVWDPKTSALWLQRLGPLAQVTNACRVPAPWAEGHSADRPAAGVGTGCGGWLVCVA